MKHIRLLVDLEGTEHVLISFLFHMVVLLLLTSIGIKLTKESDKNIIIITSNEIEENINEEKEINDITNFSTDISIKNNSSSSITQIASIPENLSPMNIDLDLNLDTPNLVSNFSIQQDILNTTINTTIGDNTSQQQSVGGVLDRLTPEIISLAQNRDINIIWLFDASISLSNQRKQIKDRIAKILSEINDSSFGTKKIEHSICSFGKTLSIISKQPTTNEDIIKQDIESIVLDDSGIENVFTSIINACDYYKKHRNAIIVFTDEVGDDISNLDKCIVSVTRQGIPVFVVGSPAPFGSSKIEFKYVDPDPKFDQKERWVEIQQGPETLFKMTLDLQTLPIDEQGLDSGYGPYALTRLCYSSGGMYFSVHPNRSKDIVSKKQIAPLSSNISRFFDASVMSKYRPDYRNIIVQQNDVSSNQIKASLLKACQIPLRIVFDQRMNFTAFSEGEFAEQLKDAQNFSARIEPKIDQIYNLLKNVEQHADNLKDNRWMASYYLAMGRILATKCRIELYNLVLAEAKSGLNKKDKKSNAWELVRDMQVDSKNSQLTKTHDSAQKYLKLVIDKYPETPWAAIAQEELNTPMGYKWLEKYIEPPKPGMGNNNNNNPNPKDDERKKLEYKPQRKLDKI